MTRKTGRILIARDVKLDEALLGLSGDNNKYEPLCLECDDQEHSSTEEEDQEEKKNVIDIEEHKISAGADIGGKPGSGVRRFPHLQAMTEADKREDKSLHDLSEMKTY